MAEIDASINDPTPTGVIVDRLDVYRIAAAELRRQGDTSASTEDVLALARFLEYGADFA